MAKNWIYIFGVCRIIYILFHKDTVQTVKLQIKKLYTSFIVYVFFYWNYKILGVCFFI